MTTETGYEIEVEARPIDDPETMITVVRVGGEAQWMFEVVDDELRYQGPANTDEWTWTDLPKSVVALAEDHFARSLVGDTEDLKRRRQSHSTE